MKELLQLEFSLFVMIAAGFLIRKLKIVSDAGEKVITDLVMNVVLPCNVFYSFLSQNIDRLAADCLWILGISVGAQAVAFLYTRIAFRVEKEKQRCNLSYAMLSPNTGFIGSPVAEGIFGPAGLMLACIYLIPQRLMMWSVGLSMYTGVNDKKAAVKKLLTHPCVIACLLGLVFLLFRIRVPEWLSAPVAMVGRCNTAMAMIVIGMIISRINLRSLANKNVILFSIHRLLVVPLIIYLICSCLPVSRTVFGVSVLLASMPAGATTSMLASRYDKDPVFAAELVVFSTICSIPAIMLWMMIVS